MTQETKTAEQRVQRKRHEEELRRKSSCFCLENHAREHQVERREEKAAEV